MSMDLAPKKKMIDGVLVKKTLTPIAKKGGSMKKNSMPKMKKGGMSKKAC